MIDLTEFFGEYKEEANLRANLENKLKELSKSEVRTSQGRVPCIKPLEIKNVLGAFDVAKHVVRGMLRKTGPLEIAHPVEVVNLTIDSYMDLLEKHDIPAPLDYLLLVSEKLHDLGEHLIGEGTTVTFSGTPEEAIDTTIRAYAKMTGDTEHTEQLKRNLSATTILNTEGYMQGLRKSHILIPKEFCIYAILKPYDRIASTKEVITQNKTGQKIELLPQQRMKALGKNVMVHQAIGDYPYLKTLMKQPLYPLVRSGVLSLARETITETTKLRSDLNEKIKENFDADTASRLQGAIAIMKVDMAIYRTSPASRAAKSVKGRSIFDGIIRYISLMFAKEYGLTPEMIAEGTPLKSGINYVPDKIMGVPMGFVETKFINRMSNDGVRITRDDVPILRHYALLLVFEELATMQYNSLKHNGRYLRIKGL